MAMMDPDPAREAKWDALEKEQTAAMGGDEKRMSFNSALEKCAATRAGS
jgi:hypothetical protein